MKIALAQLDIKWLVYKENYLKIKNMVKEAVNNKAEFIIFPEMCLTGFNMNINLLEESEIEIINKISSYALEYNINIAFGYGVKEGHYGRNKLAVISNKGEVIIKYIKLNSFPLTGEDKFYKEGKEINYFSINNYSFSSFICYDLRFPELFKEASKYVDNIIVIASWPESRAKDWNELLYLRGVENKVNIIGVNRVGEGDGLKYSGDSQIVYSGGKVIKANEHSEELVYCEI